MQTCQSHLISSPKGQALSMAALRQETRPVGGRSTQVLHIPALSEPRWQLLILPGNPGQAGYYTPFMQALHSVLEGTASVTALSHLGMDGSGLSPPGEVYSLDEQIEHKAAFLAEHMLGEGRPPVVVLGHSIGTYIGLHAVHRLEQRQQEVVGRQVLKVVGLFPFLAVNPDCRQQARISSLTHWYRQLGLLATALRLMPAPASRWLLRRWSPNLEGHAEETALQLVLNPSCIQNSLYMARCEFETLAAPPDWWLLRQLGPRFAALCSPDDMWFPRYKWEAMLQEVPDVQAYWEADQCHAFCVSSAKSHAAATRVAEILSSSGGGDITAN